MTQYLLAAEADKIQDLIFRATKLKEVVGGSQLLSEFENSSNAQSALSILRAKIAPNSEIVSAGGGSFRILFNSERQAKDFGEKLAELYRLTTGGALSVAQPTPYADNYSNSADKAEMLLRQAKIEGGTGEATAHLPYAAFCESCGLSLSGHRYKDKTLCSACRNKKLTREKNISSSDAFLFPFFKAVAGDNARQFNYPGKELDEDPAGLLGGKESRNYVAYLIADGNNMGKLFSECKNKEQTRRLSQSLTKILQNSLARPAKLLMEKQKEFKDLIPALPLILGGDDVFALLPATWALDFAGRFCREYEKEMAEIALQINPDVKPTMAAAVVICKANYPYYLAHQAGKMRLKEAKRLAKIMALEKSINSSVVNFEIITGSQLPQTNNVDKEGSVQDTLRPYWLNPAVPAQWGAQLDTLLEQRNNLANLPRRRRAQLRRHFDALRGLEWDDDAQRQARKIEPIIKRIARNKDDEDAARKALQALGGNFQGYLREVETDTASWYAHGLPDLLDAWDFSLKVDAPVVEEDS